MISPIKTEHGGIRHTFMIRLCCNNWLSIVQGVTEFYQGYSYEYDLWSEKGLEFDKNN